MSQVEEFGVDEPFLDDAARRPFTTLNMPPISTDPNGPLPVIIRAVLAGIGISMVPMSAMPRSPIAM